MDNTANTKGNGNKLLLILIAGTLIVIAGATGVTTMFLHFISCLSGD